MCVVPFLLTEALLSLLKYSFCHYRSPILKKEQKQTTQWNTFDYTTQQYFQADLDKYRSYIPLLWCVLLLSDPRKVHTLGKNFSRAISSTFQDFTFV